MLPTGAAQSAITWIYILTVLHDTSYTFFLDDVALVVF